MMVTPGPGVLSLACVGAGFGWKVGMMYLIGLFFGTNGVALLIDKNNKTELEKLDKFLIRISERHPIMKKEINYGKQGMMRIGHVEL